MLKKMISHTDGEDIINFEEARMAFFTHDSGQTKEINIRFSMRYEGQVFCSGLTLTL